MPEVIITKETYDRLRAWAGKAVTWGEAAWGNAMTDTGKVVLRVDDEVYELIKSDPDRIINSTIDKREEL